MAEEHNFDKALQNIRAVLQLCIYLDNDQLKDIRNISRYGRSLASDELVHLAISSDTGHRGFLPIILAWDRNFPRGNGKIFKRLFDDSGRKPVFTDELAWF
jgi:homoserine acetyltransferase